MNLLIIYIQRILSLWLLCLPGVSWAQDSLRADFLVQLDFENDALQVRSRSISDRYYTNGIRISCLTNTAHRWPIRHALLALEPRSSQPGQSLYNLSIGQEIYTPRNIKEVRRPLYPNDRPYAGYLYIAWGLVSTDYSKAHRLASTLILGVIGPLSGAAEMQQTYHRLTNQNVPAGWQTQLANNPAISYSIVYEGRAVPRFSSAFDVIGRVESFVGSLMNYTGVGGTIRIGRFNDYFQSATGLYNPACTPLHRKFQCYASVGVDLRAILDNSLLQGGWINQHNYYALPAVEMNHFYGQINLSGVIAYKNVQLAFIQHLRSAEFVKALNHQWGHISLTFRAGR